MSDAPVSCPRIYFRLRKMLAGELRDFQHCFGVGQRDDDRLRLIGTYCAQEFEPRRIAIVREITKPADGLHVSRLRIERVELDAAHEQHAPNNLTEPTEPADHHWCGTRLVQP